MGRKSTQRKLQAAAHRYVDMWAFPGVHPTNIELFQRLKKADDQHFGHEMDVCGTVKDKDLRSGEWEESHLVGIRTDAWSPKPETQKTKLNALQQARLEILRRKIKPSGSLNAAETERLHKLLRTDPVMKLQPGELEGRRLVLKLFRNLARIRWVGTIEELTTSEVHNSMGSKRMLLSLTAILSGHRYVTDLQENFRTFRIPSIFSLCYYHQRRERMWYLNIKRKWISIGADFVIEAEGERIGDIDGALFGLGYNAHIYVYEPELAKETQFLDLLTLFTASVGYHSAMRRSVKKRLSATLKGLTGGQMIEPEEYALLKNPRAA